jgi:hypothetical protein
MEEDIIKAGTENFNLPHDVVQLPSGGIFYKSKKKSVKVGYLTATDENMLMSGQGTNDNIIMSLLRNKLYEHDIRPEELIDGDVEAILLFLRNTSFGPEYNVTLTDPQTNKPFSHSVILDELNIKKTEFKPDENGLFTTTLPKSGVTVKIKPLTYSDTLEISAIVDSYPVGRPAPIVTLRLMKHIVEVNGDSDKSNISMFIASLPIMDSKYIRKFIRDNQPSLELVRTAVAPSGEKVSFEISFGVEFFRPFF